MVGAQNATKIASSFLPDIKRYSETTIIDNTTNSMIVFIIPIREINFFSISFIRLLFKFTYKSYTITAYMKQNTIAI